MANLKDKNFWSVAGEKSVADTQIDWGTVSKDITTKLETIRDERQTAKTLIDEATNTLMQELNKGENINNATLSTALIDGGQSAVEALQIQVDLMKRGLIKPKDYKIFMQKQQNAYTNLKNVTKNWDAWDTKSKERLAIDPNTGLQIASQLEQDFNISTSAFGNMENVKFIPTEDGGMEAVRLIKNETTGRYELPDRDTNPENFMNPNAIGIRQNFQMNTTDITTSMKKQTDALGEFIRAEESRSGRIFTSIEDFKDSPNYLTAKEDAIKALATTSLQKANIAGQMGYRFAMSEKQKADMIAEGADPSKIIMYSSNDGRPSFKDDAFDNVGIDEFLGNRFDSQLADTMKLERGLAEPRSKSAAEITKDKMDEDTGNFIKTFDKILTSTDQGEVMSALDGLVADHNTNVQSSGKGKTIVDVIFNKDMIQFIYSDGTSSPGVKRTTVDINDADGDGDKTDLIKTDIKDQIYRLGEELSPNAFNNIQDVNEWLGNNPDYQVGNPRDKDALTVNYGEEDYNYESEEVLKPGSTLMNKQEYGGDVYEDPNSGSNMSVTAVKETLANIINDMLPQTLRDDLQKDGFKFMIVSKNVGNNSDEMYDSDNRDGKFVIRLVDENGDVVDGLTQTIGFKSIADKYDAGSFGTNAGEVKFSEYAKEIDDNFLKALRPWASKRKTNRASSGAIDTSQY